MSSRRSRARLALGLLSVLGLALGGCSGGGGRGNGSASTATTSPTTSATPPISTTPTQQPPAPIATSTVPIVPPPTTTPAPGNDIYLSSFLLGNVQVVDASTLQTKTRIPVGRGPTGVATNGSYAYVASAIEQSVTVIDRLTNTVAAKIDVGSTPVTGIAAVDRIIKPFVRPTSIAVLPNGTKAFTANLLNVTSIDLVARKPLKSILSLNLPPIANLISGGTSSIGPALMNFLKMPLAAFGAGRVAATDQRVFVTNMITNNVSMISATDDKIMVNMPVGKLPFGVAVAANKAYVACALTNEIYVLDGSLGIVRKRFAAGLMPWDVAASPSGDKIYVANFVGGDVTVIDTAADLPVASLPAGLPLTAVFQQLGIPIPTGSGSGLAGALQAFLGAFLGGSAGAAGNPGSGTGGLSSLLSSLLGGGTSGTGAGGLMSPNTFMNALMSAFLGYMGINASSLNTLALPGLGIGAITVNAAGDRVVCANWFMGQVTVTEIATLKVNGLMPGTSGMGPADVAASP